MRYQLFLYNNQKEMAIASARFLATMIKGFINTTGEAKIVLSGGNTPKLTYGLLAKERIRDSIDWEKVFFFWGDERYVPHNHRESNFRMAWSIFLSKLPNIGKNVFPIPTDLDTPEECAVEYEKTLKKFFIKREKVGGYPVFDIILLGVGADGHIASLFRNEDLEGKDRRWVIATEAPLKYTVRDRITMTLQVINNSKNCIILISGDEKKMVVEKIKALISKRIEPTKEESFPVMHLKPSGDVYIFTSTSPPTS